VAALLGRDKLDETTDGQAPGGRTQARVIPLGLAEALDGGMPFVNRFLDWGSF
jgi:hypothetical protein